MLLPSVEARLANLVEEKPDILSIMTPNEARELVGLKKLKEEQRILELELLEAKTRALGYNGFTQRLYREAIDAMRGYANKF